MLYMKTELKFYEVKEGKKYKTTFYRNNYYEVSIRENLEYDYISYNVITFLRTLFIKFDITKIFYIY